VWFRALAARLFFVCQAAPMISLDPGSYSVILAGADDRPRSSVICPNYCRSKGIADRWRRRTGFHAAIVRCAYNTALQRPAYSVRDQT